MIVLNINNILNNNDENVMYIEEVISYLYSVAQWIVRWCLKQKAIGSSLSVNTISMI